MGRAVPAALLGLALIAAPAHGSADPVEDEHGHQEAIIYIVRHAEKRRVSRNPGLTKAGKVRAAALPDALHGAELAAIYATEYRRTQQTVEPVARSVGLEVRLVPARGALELAEQLLREHAGQSVLVAGHSTTIPRLLEALGVAESVHIGESRYGDLFVITVSGSEARLERRRFGKATSKRRRKKKRRRRRRRR